MNYTYTDFFTGYWRILDFDYCFRTLSYFLNLLDENSWKASRIPVKEAIELLKDIVPTGILEHIISQFSQRTGVCNDNGKYSFVSYNVGIGTK